MSLDILNLFDQAVDTSKTPFEVNKFNWKHKVKIVEVDVKRFISPRKISDLAGTVGFKDGTKKELRFDSQEYLNLNIDSVHPQYLTATLYITLVKMEDGIEKTATMSLREVTTSSNNMNADFDIITENGRKQYSISYQNLSNKLLHILKAVASDPSEDEAKQMANKAISEAYTQEQLAIIATLKNKNWFMIEAIGKKIKSLWEKDKNKEYFVKLVRQGGTNPKYCNNLQIPDNFQNFFTTPERSQYIVPNTHDKFDFIPEVEVSPLIEKEIKKENQW